ncbi:MULTISPECIES: MFS transporter [unclassified Micromonospora]|uniref:MFS transporter n=1 Tax=unclassified Micromonospora TaxID=2617518 RepID=UPI0022B748A9|nr:MULTISPECIES: MFS transporter [unclassified Micromonospora]MCZ7418665.1 MFS transporter [Verrucosispora sp. WMMA2121]WBB92367.1 MFS transporter [Verrucosispora sp. WMMC514]
MLDNAVAVTPAPTPLLRSPSFVRLWTGTMASGVATWALPFILGLAVLDRSLTGVGLGVLLATRTVGFVAAMPVAGVLADRYSRRKTVLWSGLTAALATPVMAMSLERSLLVAAAAAFVMGAGQGACRPAFQALTAEVVAEPQRQQANAAITLAVRVTTLVAPTLTALLAVAVSTPVLLWGVGALWLVAALVPPPGNDSPPPSTTRPNILADFADGLREARRHPWFVAGLAALTAVIATGYSATFVVLPLVSRDRFGSEAVLAAAMTTYTIGALVGAMIIARWRPRAQGWSALAGLALYGLVPLSLLLPVNPVVIFAAYVLAGIGIELFNVPWFTATQREVEPAKLARVSSLDFLLSYGLAPVGLALIAPAIDQFGATVVLAVCAVVCFAAPAAAAVVPSSRGFSASHGKSNARLQ